jgi:hypothetical protein
MLADICLVLDVQRGTPPVNVSLYALQNHHDLSQSFFPGTLAAQDRYYVRRIDFDLTVRMVNHFCQRHRMAPCFENPICRVLRRHIDGFIAELPLGDVFEEGSKKWKEWRDVFLS